MAKPRIRVPISTARAKLFQLADLVRGSADDTAVVLEQRSGGEPVALVREARLAYLEDRVAQLETRQAPEPFTLAGSLSSSLDAASRTRVLRDIRHAWVPHTGDAVDRRAAPKRPGRAR